MKPLRAVRSFFSGMDHVQLLLCAACSAFGVLIVSSVTRSEIAEGAIMSRDARTMLIAVALGAFAAVIISVIDYSVICRLWPVIAAGCLGLMAAVFLFGVGPNERQDAKTWLAFGPIYFQPSELLKIGFAVTYAVHLERVRDTLNRPLTVLLLLIHAAVPAVIVLRSGDMGSALIFLAMALVMLFFSGLRAAYFAGFAAAAAAAAPVAWRYVLKDLQKERILGLIYPDRYEDIMYQQQHGMTALTSGGFTGKGLFRSTLTSDGYVPESENDMVFTAVGEELGVLGCALAIALLFFVVFRIFSTASKCSGAEGRIMCCGVGAFIAAQSVINIGMCLRILPVIGITLPFFSAGGSSNLCVWLGIGLVLSVRRYSSLKGAKSFRLGFITEAD
ncbi:MAG: FtsW/RodA/SpoVE family cell cycle protein [Clostridia bacterium]|nr:FtsW/RodA/SpoVE family cell cycle protein [Clostridia bacterium]